MEECFDEGGFYMVRKKEKKKKVGIVRGLVWHVATPRCGAVGTERDIATATYGGTRMV